MDCLLDVDGSNDRCQHYDDVEDDHNSPFLGMCGSAFDDVLVSGEVDRQPRWVHIGLVPTCLQILQRMDHVVQASAWQVP